MDMVIFFALMFSALAFAVFFFMTIYSIIRKRNWKKNAKISGGLLIGTFLLFVFFGSFITDEDEVMMSQRSEIQAQGQSISDYEESTKELENEIATLTEQINSTKENDENTSNEEIEKLKADLEEEKKLSKQYKDELSSIKENDETDKLSATINELEKENKSLEDKVKKLEESAKEKETADKPRKEEKKAPTNKEPAKAATPEDDIENIINGSNDKVKSVTISKDGDLYEPSIVIDGTGYLWAVEASAKSDIADVVYSLKESEYKYGFINIIVEMEFIDTYGNEKISTGYEAEFTQEILDKLTDDKYMIIDKIDQTANYWFAHPGI